MTRRALHTSATPMLTCCAICSLWGLLSFLVRTFIYLNAFRGKCCLGILVLTTLCPKLQVLADVVSIMTEKIDMVTLDMFTCLLPLLNGLLESDLDRWGKVLNGSWVVTLLLIFVLSKRFTFNQIMVADLDATIFCCCSFFSFWYPWFISHSSALIF